MYVCYSTPLLYFHFSASMIIFLIIVIFALIRNRKVLADKSESMVPAKAGIISAAFSDVKAWDTEFRNIVKLLMEINISGNMPYRASTLWLVNDEGKEKIKPGSEIDVKIDGNDKKIVYPDVPWAMYSEQE